MTQTTTAPYGTWKSPITSDLIVSEVIGLSQPQIDEHAVTWIEMRPCEGGRNVIVRRETDGSIIDLLPVPFNARTRVHEYGGGDYVVGSGVIYFSNFVDQQVYMLDRSGIRPITNEKNYRYADYALDASSSRLIAVCEDHYEEGKEPRNAVVSINLASPHDKEGKVLASGNDFYASPRLSPDGAQLAWLTWDHPNMPWDGCELWLGDFDSEGGIQNTRKVAGGIDESIFQPEWSPDGILYFVSDRTGWWNLYRLANDGVEALHPIAAEFAMPQWVFGMS